MEDMGGLWAWEAGRCNGGLDMATKKYKKRNRLRFIFFHNFSKLDAFLRKRKG